MQGLQLGSQRLNFEITRLLNIGKLKNMNDYYIIDLTMI